MGPDKPGAAGNQNLSFHILLLAYLLLLGLTTPAALNWPTKISLWIFALLLFWLIGPFENTGTPKYGNLEISTRWFLLPLGIFVVSRLLPFFRWGEFPLGADAALYLKQFESLPPELIYAIYIFLNFLIGWGIYLVAKAYFNNTTAFFAVLIFSLSISQFLAYWIFQMRAMPAIFLFLLYLYFLKNGSWLIVPLAGLIGFWHSPTFLPILPSLILSSFINKQKKFYLVSAAVILFIFIAVNWQKDIFSYFYYLNRYLTTDNSFEFVKLVGGYFASVDFYTSFLSLFYLPFALLGFIRTIALKRINHLLVVALVLILLIPLNFLFFNNRLIILLDLIMIILAASVLKDFVGKILNVRYGIQLLFCALLLIVAFVFLQIWQTEPLVNNRELMQIKSLAKIEPEVPIFTTSPLYQPLLIGFSGHSVLEMPSTSSPFYIYRGRRSYPQIAP